MNASVAKLLGLLGVVLVIDHILSIVVPILGVIIAVIVVLRFLGVE